MFSIRIGTLQLGVKDSDGTIWGVEKPDGLGSTGSTREQVQRARRSGALSGRGYAQARQISVPGVVSAPTPALAAAAEDKLLDAVSLEDTPFAFQTVGDTRYMTVHRTDDTITDWIDDCSFEYSFQVASDDWRKFGQPLTPAPTKLPSTSGGLSIPYSIPYSIPATLISGQINLFNPGNETGPVSIRIDGPCSAPTVTHRSSRGVDVVATSLVLGAGEFIIVDMERGSILANGQASRARHTTSRSWFGFDPGDNTFAFSAASYDAGAQMTVTATPAWK